ncbi:MAG: DNA repair protein RadA [Chlorobi bacterium]|nr:DNA repair protein RadA [Chlorobiota bacterium]
MAKSKSVYICQNCGAESPKWVGHCPVCREWNTYVEERIPTQKLSRKGHIRNNVLPPAPLSEVESSGYRRHTCGIGEFNRLLGGGLVPGSLILLGGEPGIGKSTLALQIAMQLGKAITLYVSGEESPEQIKIRADRLNLNQEKCLIYGENLFENIATEIHKIKPGLVVIDSIQTIRSEEIESSPGSVSQVRESAARFLLLAKETGIPVLLIGHITKDGTLAGPKVLEHIVDVVLQFEGNQQHLFRMLRVLKNRFGSTSELALFEMKESGLKEITNPSELLLSHLDDRLSGIATAATIDGIRPFLIEVQALVSPAVYSAPQRTVTGFDPRRLAILLAVLEKRAGFMLSSKDVFLNIAGGLRVDDPAIDLAVTTAVISSMLDVPLDNDIAFSAEIGLSGEIRPVARIADRIREATKLGFKQIMISGYNARKLESDFPGIRIIPVRKLEEVLKKLFKT